MRLNSWPVHHTQDGGVYEATFGPDDFEAWFLSPGVDRATRVTTRDRRELFENCVYLAEAENRRMTQTRTELIEAIADWAQEWNKQTRYWVKPGEGETK